ncbi:ABC transporter substrate-binding protein [Camelimonas abortus]|uniref:ABC transporter substrate-binding protein n=1 Tax=Camelimonas abortus TaxID=1017184 RepID=A0ABV7LFG7_9HYPH
MRNVREGRRGAPATRRAALALLGAGLALAAASAAADEKPPIRIGNLAPYSGPASSYSAFAKTQAAYFRMVNARGGVNGRKVEFISYDDAYSPPKAVEQARKLVEQDGVLAIVQAVGTPPNAAIMKYMNARKTPQLFAATGATKFGDYRNYPWTMGLSTSVYHVEAALYADYIRTEFPNARVAVLYPNDDYGKDIFAGFRKALGRDYDRFVVSTATYDNSEPTIDSQMTKLKASGANVFVNFSTPRFAAQAIRKVAELGWKPDLQIVNTTGASISLVFRPAGIENAKGVVTATSMKEPNDPRYASDPDVQEYLAFMKEWYPEGDPGNNQNAYGYMCIKLVHRVLEMAGDDLSRENIMRQATSLKDVKPGLLLDGITVNTSPTNYFPITQMQLMRFNGASFDPIGEIRKYDVSPYD